MTVETTNEQYDHHRGSDPLLRPGGPKRAAIVLAVNFAVFVLACAFFWQYLARGQWLDLSADGYYQGLNTPLSTMFVQPLSVFSHPWMIAVISLLLALIFVVPVLIAVLYDEVLALVFVLLVAALGRAPALALLQAVGCVLAARTRFRSDGPFIAALLGLAPLLAYLGIFALTVSESVSLPLKQWVLYAVMALAAVGSVLAAAGVLGLVKLIRYKPGALCPVIVALFATGVMVFHVRVGSDELDYALLAARLDRPGKPDALFKSVSLEAWIEAHDADDLDREELTRRVRGDITARRDDLIARCEAFLSDHAESARAPGVLWLEAQARSLVLHEAAYEAAYEAVRVGPVDGNPQGLRPVLIAYSAEFVLPEARDTWNTLLTAHGGSPHAALAAWRMGQLALRHWDRMGEAEKLLARAHQQLTALLAGGGGMSNGVKSGRVFVPASAIPYGNADYYQRALQDVVRLQWLIRENHVLSDTSSAKALAALVSLNRNDPGYAPKLEDLAGQYENTHMGDNLKLAVALVAETKLAKATALLELARDALTDAGIEANYVLGCLTMQTGKSSALPLVPDVKAPRQYFNIVANAAPNPWTREARDRLALLKAEGGATVSPPPGDSGDAGEQTP